VSPLRAAALALAAALAFPLRAAASAPLTLDDALAVAARDSAELALARADAERAAAEGTFAVGGVLPRLDLTTSFGHDFAGPSGEPRFVLDAAGPLLLEQTPAFDQEAYALTLRLSQPLFDWAAFREVTRARESARAARRQYAEAELTVAFEVTRRFYEVVRAERTLAVLEDTARRSEELVGRAEALFAAGRAPRSEILQARVNLANDRVAVESQRLGLARARHALGEALGRGAGEAVAVVAPASLEAPVAAAPEPPPLDELVHLARARRPALAAQEALVSAADAAVSGATARWLPAVSAQASYLRQGSELGAREGVYGDPARAYTATTQVVLSWNLFEGRRTRATVRQAQATARRARAAQEQAAAPVERELADARSAVAALGSEVALAAESLGLAEAGLALARERLDAGLASQLEVRDASLKLTQAALSLLEARIDHAVARADLARAAGGPL
jgi:outer membrane protein TolC